MDTINVAFKRPGDLTVLAARWRDLESRADGGYFLSWDWIGCWLELVETEVVLLEGRSGGKVVALGLLCPVRQRYGWLSTNGVYLHQTGDPRVDGIAIEYNGILTDRALGTEGALQCLRALLREDAIGTAGRRWDELYLNGVTTGFADAVVECGAWLRLLARSPTWYVDLAAIRADGGAYLDRLSANTRYQVRRSMRRYEARGPLRLTAASDVAEGLDYLDELAALHQAHWIARGRPGAFSAPFFTAFHRRLIADCLPCGSVEVLRATAGETTIGYLYNFLYRGRVYYYASGFVYEDDNRLKPGLVSHTLSVSRYLAQGMDCYDFMAGAARYKTSLGQPGPTMRAFAIQRPRARLLAMDALRWARDVVRRRAIAR